jgi:hypothetical protein
MDECEILRSGLRPVVASVEGQDRRRAKSSTASRWHPCVTEVEDDAHVILSSYRAGPVCGLAWAGVGLHLGWVGLLRLLCIGQVNLFLPFSVL